jgi:hypothetical protein
MGRSEAAIQHEHSGQPHSRGNHHAIVVIISVRECYGSFMVTHSDTEVDRSVARLFITSPADCLFPAPVAKSMAATTS